MRGEAETQAGVLRSWSVLSGECQTIQKCVGDEDRIRWANEETRSRHERKMTWTRVKVSNGGHLRGLNLLEREWGGAWKRSQGWHLSLTIMRTVHVFEEISAMDWLFSWNVMIAFSYIPPEVTWIFFHPNYWAKQISWLVIASAFPHFPLGRHIHCYLSFPIDPFLLPDISPVLKLQEFKPKRHELILFIFGRGFSHRKKIWREMKTCAHKDWPWIFIEQHCSDLETVQISINWWMEK